MGLKARMFVDTTERIFHQTEMFFNLSMNGRLRMILKSIT